MTRTGPRIFTDQRDRVLMLGGLVPLVAIRVVAAISGPFWVCGLI